MNTSPKRHWGDPSSEDPVASKNPTKPILFLDVDGVLNACLDSFFPGHSSYRYQNVLDYPIHYDTTVIAFLNEITDSGAAEIVWLTTWQEDARSVLGPQLGLNDFPVVSYSGGSEFHWELDWWKWRAVRAYLGDNEAERPVIWLDDDLTDKIRDQFYYRYDQECQRSFLHSPDPSFGLTEDELAGLTAFLERVAVGQRLPS